MKFYVYQFALQDHSAFGYFRDDSVADIYFQVTRGNVSWETFQEYFKCVGNIEATDLDEAFEIGNIGPEEKIERYGKMTSLSVGNIIGVGGRYYIVKPFGFEEFTKVAA